MLVHRLATGSVLVAVFSAVLFVDERFFAPYFPLWFVLCFGVMGWVALEMIGLLNVTSARPSGNTVFGGVLAMVVANWAPHITTALLVDPRLSPGTGSHDPAVPVDALAWPLWAFVGVVMFSFVAQSLQFDRPGKTMATISGTVLATAYVGLLGSFVLQMRWLEGPYHGLVPLVALLATAKGGGYRRLHAGPAGRPAQALAQPEPEQDDRGGLRWADLLGDGFSAGRLRRPVGLDPDPELDGRRPLRPDGGHRGATGRPDGVDDQA